MTSTAYQRMEIILSTVATRNPIVKQMIPWQYTVLLVIRSEMVI
ncbi:MAG: hypothetical protein ACM3VV_06075 [Deltaproteobacteria bacterium]